MHQGLLELLNKMQENSMAQIDRTVIFWQFVIRRQLRGPLRSSTFGLP